MITVNNNKEINDIEISKEILLAIDDSEKIRIRESILSIHKNNTKTKMVFINNIKSLSIAASVAGIFVAGGLALNYYANSSYSNKILYSENFNPTFDIAKIRSDTNIKVSDAVANGIIYFQNREYNNAIDVFKTDSTSIMAKFYLGLCYMQINKFKEAEASFKFIIENNNNLFMDQAEWNLGLCYLNTGKEKLAKKIFKKIVIEKGAYSDKANIILQAQ